MKKWVPFVLMLLLGVFLLFPLLTSEDQFVNDYEEFWADRETFFRDNSASPFVEKETTFKSLNLYPPDEKYVVSASLERYSKREVLRIVSSDDTEKAYLKFGQIHFTFDDEKQSLVLLKELSFRGQYFLGFGDSTSGGSTYGGGRYMDVVVGKSDRLTLDFNRAYNPYCAYFDDYVCPLPPIENLLDIAIEAGEKNYH
ncbi:MAG: DUF1684 domain-containing protein [Bacteroidota bacterium]